VDTEAIVVGAGVAGAATALALARRAASVVVVEAEDEPGLAASGTNSGIIHTGFDSVPGALETDLILRSAVLRPPVLEALDVPVLRCGAIVHGSETVLAHARRNGVEVAERGDGHLDVPGEAVTDPVAFTLSLVAGAQRHGAEVRTGFRVGAIERDGNGISVQSAGGDHLRSAVVINCAGLYADAVARLAGDDSFEIYPRKGEFLVFDPPPGEVLDQILLPLPTSRTKGVLVFPTIDGKVIAGPTAVDQEDKENWSVRSEARGEIVPKAIGMWTPLEGARQIAAYAGLRPAGRGVNYLIERSRACDALVNVAAIRSTGLTASLGIAERVCLLVEQAGVRLGDEAPLERGEPFASELPWWRRAAERGSR
jgi:glycerol-3-phosphate dehydrogenase